MTGLTEAVAVLVYKSAESMSLANLAWFRFFTTADACRQYEVHEVEVEPVQ